MAGALDRVRKESSSAALTYRTLALLVLGALCYPGCAAKSLFDPPDTRIVGQTLGTMLAISYTATLMQHALSVGKSPCYELLLSDHVATGGVDMAALSVSKECGFPFPGQATGAITVAGFDPAGVMGYGVADYSSVRVDGRPLPIAQAKGFLAVAADQARQHGIEQMPGRETLLEQPSNPLVILFVDVEITPSMGSDQIDLIRVDEWFGLVSRGNTLDDFADDGYWIGGQRATVTPALAEVSQEFVAFSPGCRANPQLGFVQLVRASEQGKGSGASYLIFVPECEGAGYVAISMSENVLSAGRHAPLDLLGP
jgi:hypothetical protein